MSAGQANGGESVLLPQHAALITTSGIGAAAAAARGYWSVIMKSDLRSLGFSDSQIPARVRGLASELARAVRVEVLRRSVFGATYVGRAR